MAGAGTSPIAVYLLPLLLLLPPLLQGLVTHSHRGTACPWLVLRLGGGSGGAASRFLLPLALRRSPVCSVARARCTRWQLPLAHAAGWGPRRLRIPRASLERWPLRRRCLGRHGAERPVPLQICCGEQSVVRLKVT